MDKLMKKHMAVSSTKAAYLTYNEELWDPLLQRQVIEPISDLRSRITVDKFYLIAFIPWHDCLRKCQQIADIKTRLTRSNIIPVILPSFAPFPLPYFLPVYDKGRWQRVYKMSAIAIPFVLLHTLPLLLIMHLLFNVKVFHCRSYPASVAALICKIVFRDFRFIFDPRSDYPEENVMSGNWKLESTTFKVWKWLEKKFVKYADNVVCIAETYRTHFSKANGEANYVIIPNNVDVTRFAVKNDTFRNKFRRDNGLGKKLVFCYLGTMSLESYHNPAIYVKTIKAFRILEQPHIFLFLIPDQSVEVLIEAMKTGGIANEEYLIHNPMYDEVPSYLSIADYGILFFGRKTIRLGTKVVEYTAAGLPVLVNSNVEGALSVVVNDEIGCIIDIGAGDADREVSADKIKLLGNKTYCKASIQKYSELNYSNGMVVNEYRKVYELLAGS
jgi:glycosyltransferase involved in cell wall biosynthesis